ncbi:hypothetical protein HW130_34495 [Streptomyces sp. PKU-EA00015]|uniref:hypothetical protein n=1 Tax=Streptomyces sp. PKU-EA00015 TaxID=2748326 RepID=UPI0015A149D5|nr:hypothetical protein [Streptomyces sp. PKU-EA00015]NWF31278.1 hypothetical protein [Streptomyces sp. PKU-EA00015]
MDAHARPAGAADKGRSDWCHWHKGPSETARQVRLVERQSGSPLPLYACAPCREQRDLSPAIGWVEV